MALGFFAPLQEQITSPPSSILYPDEETMRFRAPLVITKR